MMEGSRTQLLRWVPQLDWYAPSGRICGVVSQGSREMSAIAYRRLPIGAAQRFNNINAVGNKFGNSNAARYRILAWHLLAEAMSSHVRCLERCLMWYCFWTYATRKFFCSTLQLRESRHAT